MKTTHYYIAILKAALSVLITVALISPLHAQVVDSTWYRPNQLINHPMPPINGSTINGMFIDASFFKDNVVVLAFGNLLNVNSLKEIEFLNRLQQDFKGHPFKVLGVMPNAKQDVKDFNDPSAENQGQGHLVRLSFQVPLMEYPVIATCDQRNTDNTLHPACDNVVKDYLISGYPVICLVDKNGIIRYIHVNMAPKEQLQDWYNSIEEQIGLMLKQQ